jgi:hypothetical protein
MITLDKYTSQFVRYAKGHFDVSVPVNTDMVEHIREICSWRSEVEGKYITNEDIVIVLLEVMKECNLTDKMTQYSFYSKLMGFDLYTRGYNDIKRFVMTIMSELVELQVRNKDEVLVEIAPKDIELEKRFIS